MVRRRFFALSLLALVCLGAVACSSGTSTAGIVQAVAGEGSAAPGNNSNAVILILVTDSMTGAAVSTLPQSDFQVINQIGLTGQSCGFSNNITGFNNVGTGAYQLSVATHSTTPPQAGCQWMVGDYLGQVIVTSATVNGQAAFKLSIR